jgi:hypothetical protein
MKRSFLALLFLSWSPWILSVGAQNFNTVLGRPTNNSVTFSILFDQNAEVYWEYGISQGSYPLQTALQQVQEGVPLEFELAGLSADKKYFYRTRYRAAGSGLQFLAGPEYSFHTQRAPGNSFSFTIEADDHLYDKKGAKSLYKICLANQLNDGPDFMFDLGDMFGDDHYPFTISSHDLDSLHLAYRPLLGDICHSVPLYLCLGNHEGENDYYMAQNPPENLAIWATLWRKYYYPNPFPNSFYSGNTDNEPYGVGNPENYYSWTWGNALFVVLDVYRDECDTTPKPKNWNWSLGYPQYKWLKNTLENSQAKFKFVFAHHTRGQGRGGISTAKYFEWGGYEADGSTYGFDNKRQGWGKPIHQLFVDNGVNIFFQGHDHLFAHEVLDGVAYNEVPISCDSTYRIGMLANGDAYTGDKYDGAGHVRVSVGPECVRVDFVRAYLPADTLNGAHHNGEVAFSYTIGDCPTGIEAPVAERKMLIYPNPAQNRVCILPPDGSRNFTVTLYNILGNPVLHSEGGTLDLSGIPEGLYLVVLSGENGRSTGKLIVSR